MKKEHKKMGFFQKVILAITDFRFYPLMLKTESLARSIGHFVLFFLILTLIMTTCFYDTAITGMDALLARYEEKIPEFYLEDGTLSVETKEVYKVLNDFVIVVNTDNKYDEIGNLDEYNEFQLYDNRLHINSDAITYESELGYTEVDGTEAVQITQLPLSEIAVNYNKASLHQYIEDIRTATTTRVFVFMMLFMATVISYAFTKLFEVFLYAIMTSLVATISGMKLNFKNYVKIALYIVTLPYILETISVVYLGGVSENSFIISNLIAYIYILYAVRAVKLDAFLLIMNNPTNLKKSKDGKTVISIEKEQKIDSEISNNENESEDENEEKNENLKTDDEENVQK